MRRKLYGIAGAFAALVIPYVIMSIDTQVETSQSLCPHKMLTGLPCPGCGITKSLIFFYKGDIYQSLSFHLLGPLVFLAAIFTIILLTTEIITGRNYFHKTFYSRKTGWILGLTLGIYHLVRTIYFVSQHSFAEILKESIWA